MTTLTICVNIDEPLDKSWRNRIQCDITEVLEKLLNDEYVYDSITYEWKEQEDR